MNDTTAAPDGAYAGIPLHYWPVALLSSLWNAFGCFDYAMTASRNAGYLAQFPPEAVAYIDGMAGWALAAWACGVWAGLFGSLFLLLRWRFAIHAFALSLAGLAATTSYQETVAMPDAMTTAGMQAMTAAIWVVAILLLVYAGWMRRRGVIR